MGLKYLKGLAPKEKLNPAQPGIQAEQGDTIPTNQYHEYTVAAAFRATEVTSRCMNMLVDGASMLQIDVGDSIGQMAAVEGIRPKKLANLLRYKPNPFMDINSFKRLLFMDLLAEGNFFVYYDGEGLYHLPAVRVEIITDAKKWVTKYKYTVQGTSSRGSTEVVYFEPDEIIHIKDNAVNNVYRGTSRVISTFETLNIRYEMNDFRKSFYRNGAVVGLVVETEATLSKRIKERTELEWVQKFKPKKAGRPLILDGGMKAKSIAETNFSSMDFSGSLTDLEKKVAMGLGVPYILLESGNNANIKPNIELMYSQTILPMFRKFLSALERYFGYSLEVDPAYVPALQPDQDLQSKRLTALVNNGIITGNEARKEMRLEPLDDPAMDEIRIPANIAGSATGVSGQEGGRPTADPSDSDVTEEPEKSEHSDAVVQFLDFTNKVIGE